MNSSQYDTHSLRYLAAKRLGLNDVPDALWNKTITRRYVQWWEDATSPTDKRTIQEHLVDLVREDVSALKDAGVDVTAWITAQRHGSSSARADLAPDDPIALRAEALCVYWAKLAEADRDVRSFRAKILGGSTISADEAGRLIASPAAALVRAEYFARRDVPIAGHTAEMEISERSNPFERPYVIRGRLHIEWRTGHAVLPFKNEGPAPPEPMEIWNGTEPTLIAPWPLSVLGELRKTATKLTERYPWKIPDAAWFVLTNHAPWVPPLTASSSGPDLVKNHGTITIQAAHWVPEERVTQLLAEIKARMKPSPTTSRRRIALFRFVAERSSPITERLVFGLETPPWRALQAQWNEDHPPGHEWHYSDVRNFRRDFAEASKSLIGY